ncbi:DUF4157 domain-containing protein [Streptomyces sp. RKAG290]|uniref:eCIS core domain-containing protein n=1 Tax=Streptomyces sp. RKAG290 TaxID=2888348 RepID=UPI0020346C92|nr:DUF4157 domain-containing protein [Streptomyces sp. RKAG290]MCM2415365.1 DUF4157 domain-containing protein [Streptomyces sp. RKAG290]
MPTHERRDRHEVRETDAGRKTAARTAAPSDTGAVQADPRRPLRPEEVTALQRSAGNAAAAAAVQRSSVHHVLNGSSRPLDDSVRGEMENRFGTDFGDVRLHTGPAAERSAADIGARAYTAGSHVVIGRGGGDKHTLAHELTHVVQQRRGPVSGTDSGHGFALSDPGDRFEKAAEANAHKVMAGPAPEAAPAGDHVQRAPATDTAGAGADPAAVQRAMTTATEDATVAHYTPTKAGTGTAQDLRVKRPRTVTGDVNKTGTAGRPAAPNPIAVKTLQQAYKAQASGNKWKVPSDADVWRDLFGGAGYDRGHVMGLEVGGQDDPKNIVPQWSLNQGTGMWRRIEQELADLGSGTVRFQVHYASASGNHRTVMVPTRIDIEHNSAPYKSWGNEPDTNDLIRAGADPSDLFDFYADAMEEKHYAQGQQLTADEMQDFVLAAMARDRADNLAQIDYHDTVTQGGTPGASTADAHAAGMTRSTIPADRRKKTIEKYVDAGLVSRSGTGDKAVYTLHDVPAPASDSDSSSSSSSDTEMSEESQSQGRTILSVTFDSQSSGDEYQEGGSPMSTSP